MSDQADQAAKTIGRIASNMLVLFLELHNHHHIIEGEVSEQIHESYRDHGWAC